MLTALLATAALASFSPTSDNPYFPLQPGMRWVYEGSEGGAQLRAEGAWRAGSTARSPAW